MSMQNRDPEVAIQENPGIFIMYSSEAIIHACMSLPSFNRISAHPGIAPLEQGKIILIY